MDEIPIIVVKSCMQGKFPVVHSLLQTVRLARAWTGCFGMTHETRIGHLDARLVAYRGAAVALYDQGYIPERDVLVNIAFPGY